MVFTFILQWPIFCIITYILYGNNTYNSFPLPEILTATFGAVNAALTCPFFALITIVTMGTRMKEENNNEDFHNVQLDFQNMNKDNMIAVLNNEC